jgi:hypothetical protein
MDATQCTNREALVSVRTEYMLSVDVYTRNLDSLSEMVSAFEDAPKGYVCREITIESRPRIRAYDPKRGAYVCTLVVGLAPEKGEDTEGADILQTASEQQTARLMRAVAEDNRAGSEAAERARYARETGGRSDDALTHDWPGGTSDMGTYPGAIGYSVPTAADDAIGRRVKLRAVHIEQIAETLRRQDEFSVFGVKPFPDRMAFADHLGNIAISIKTLIPRPGGAENREYREMLKAIAANCVRELDRLSDSPSST